MNPTTRRRPPTPAPAKPDTSRGTIEARAINSNRQITRELEEQTEGRKVPRPRHPAYE